MDELGNQYYLADMDSQQNSNTRVYTTDEGLAVFWVEFTVETEDRGIQVFTYGPPESPSHFEEVFEFTYEIPRGYTLAGLISWKSPYLADFTLGQG